MNKSSRKVMSFTGGIHPVSEGKKLTDTHAVHTAPLLERYTVLVQQNAGKAPDVVVKPGDKVLKYQLLAKASGFVSADLHSPTSGEIAGIVEVPGPMGVPALALDIRSDGEDRACEIFAPIPEWRSAEPQVLLQRVADAGLVGMGGASFPTRVKLSIPPGKKVDTLILNGAECEPYLSADHRLMLESPCRVLEGAAIIGHLLGIQNIYVGIEINKHDAIAELERFSEDYGIRIVPLQVQYPQGSEKQLINAIVNRAVPPGGLPADVGCVVQNVGTAAAVSDAVTLGIPLVERIVTVTGKVLKDPGNWKLRIGTPVIKAIEFCGGITAEPSKLILGGPMMGFAQNSYEVPVSKNTSGILLFSRRRALNYSSGSCIRCGRCVQGCPMGLCTCLLATAIEGGRYDLAEQNHVMDCLECGSCAYVCPAHRPLVQTLRLAKAEIRRQRAAAKANGGK
ncbi:MAG: electron transport complex subunit RsxC [Victivallaceae bacterium]|nr:electron transport complex subunit RsxC [Victivallaceae bacterium]